MLFFQLHCWIERQTLWMSMRECTSRSRVSRMSAFNDRGKDVTLSHRIYHEYPIDAISAGRFINEKFVQASDERGTQDRNTEY